MPTDALLTFGMLKFTSLILNVPSPDRILASVYMCISGLCVPLVALLARVCLLEV